MSRRGADGHSAFGGIASRPASHDVPAVTGSGRRHVPPGAFGLLQRTLNILLRAPRPRRVDTIQQCRMRVERDRRAMRQFWRKFRTSAAESATPGRISLRDPSYVGESKPTDRQPAIRTAGRDPGRGYGQPPGGRDTRSSGDWGRNSDHTRCRLYGRAQRGRARRRQCRRDMNFPSFGISNSASGASIGPVQYAARRCGRRRSSRATRSWRSSLWRSPAR